MFDLTVSSISVPLLHNHADRLDAGGGSSLFLCVYCGHLEESTALLVGLCPVPLDVVRWS